MSTVSRRTLAIVALTAVAVTTAGVSPASAHPSPHAPATIALPAGWQPEGIAIGTAPYAYLGSRATGDIRYATGTNANGISASPDGTALIIVQTNTGKLFRTSLSGRTTPIDLGAESVVNGDGIWWRGRTLYVVQNQNNEITKVALNRSGTRGTVISRTGDPRFDVPTTIAEFGHRFYLPNARFTTTPTPTTPYTAVAVRIP